MENDASKPRLFQSEPGPHNTVWNWQKAPIQEFPFFARAFHTAAKTLVESLDLDRNPFTDWNALPIVFLYRHAVELYLKGILLGPGRNFLPNCPSPECVCKNHSLKRLLPFITAIFEAVGWNEGLGSGDIATFNDFVSVIEQLEDAGVRYPLKKDKDKGLTDSVDHHFTFSVIEFSRCIEAALGILEGATIGLPEKWNARAEAAASVAEAWGGDEAEPPCE
jgi:hypothetical protein